MILILLGAPGSGKGTIAGELARIYGIPHISSGDIFRHNMRERTALGIEAERYILSGDLVPDGVTINMIDARMSEVDCRDGFLLDGFPRTVFQAESLDKRLALTGRHCDAVLNILLSDQTILERVAGRRVCASCGESYNADFHPSKVEGICDACGGQVVMRPDDSLKTVAKRLEVYHAQVAPLIVYYTAKGLLVNFDNELTSAKSVETIKTYLSGRV
jgi:adenylate kinase